MCIIPKILLLCFYLCFRGTLSNSNIVVTKYSNVIDAADGLHALLAEIGSPVRISVLVCWKLGKWGRIRLRKLSFIWTSCVQNSGMRCSGLFTPTKWLIVNMLWEFSRINTKICRLGHKTSTTSWLCWTSVANKTWGFWLIRSLWQGFFYVTDLK